MESIESLFLLTLRASWNASTLVAVILGLQWLFRRQLTPNWRYLLWFAFLARLVFPIMPSSTLSVHNISPLPFPTNQEVVKPPVLAADTPKLHRAHNLPIHKESTTIQSPIGFPLLQSNRVKDGNSTPETEWVSRPSEALSPVERLSLLWITVAAGLILLLLAKAIRFNRILATTQTPIPSALEDRFHAVKKSLGIEQRHIALTLSSQVKSPCLFGIYRPRLIIPTSLEKDLSSVELECVLLHELVHLKRNDLWCNWAMSLLQCLHWFNPVLWFAMSRIRADREMATDAGVLLQANELQRACYGELIIKLLARLRRQKESMTGAVTMVESKRQLQDRIRAIARFSSTHRTSTLGLMLALLTLLSFLLDASPTETDASSKNAPITAKVIVTVLDDNGKRPIEGSRVDVSLLEQAPESQEWKTKGEFSLTEFTDSSGRAVIENIPTGAKKYRFTATHDNDVKTSITINTETSPLPVEANILVKDSNYVSGVVTDSSGRPIANVIVTIYFAGGYERGGTELTTDSNGRWQCTILPKDIEVVSVSFQHPDFALEPLVQRIAGSILIPPYAVGPNAIGKQEKLRRKHLSLTELPNRVDRTTLVNSSPFRGLVINQAGLAVTNATIVINAPPHIETLRTDSKGAFFSKNTYVENIQGSLSAKGYAPQGFSVDIQPDMPDQTFTLSRGHSIRFRFVSSRGTPLEGVRAIPTGTRFFSISRSYFYETSDEDGFLEWKNAPNEPISFVFGSQDYYPVPDQTLSPGKDVHLIRLNKKLVVRLNATDTGGNPIPSFHVDRATHSHKYTNWDPDISVSGQDGWATFPDPMSPYYRSVQEWPSYIFRVEAEGYVTAHTRAVNISEEEASLSVMLRSRDVVERTLVDASGKPLTNRQLWLLDPSKHYSVSTASLTLEKGKAEEIRTDKQGRFVIPNRPRTHSILGLFEDGFLLESLNETQTHTLTPWGSLSGKWLEDGQVKKGVKVGFNPKPQNAIHSRSASIHVIDSTATDEKGSFAFARVPAMDVRVYRVIELDRLTNYQWFNTININPSAEKSITLNHPKLRSLQGTVKIPEAVKSRTAPGYITGTFEPGGYALLESKSNTLDSEEYERWYLDWIKSEKGKAHMATREKTPHGVSVDESGNLSALSIFPGEYLLTLIYERMEVDHQRRHPRSIVAKATRKLEITSDSPDVIELGRITLQEVTSQTN